MLTFCLQKVDILRHDGAGSGVGDDESVLSPVSHLCLTGDVDQNAISIESEVFEADADDLLPSQQIVDAENNRNLRNKSVVVVRRVS